MARYKASQGVSSGGPKQGRSSTLPGAARVPVGPDGSLLTPFLRESVRAQRQRQKRRRRMTLSGVLAVAIVASVILTSGGTEPPRRAGGHAQLGNEEETTPTTNPPTTVVGGTPVQAAAASQALQVSAQVVAENALPGSSGWKLNDPANNGEDRKSVV